MLCTWTEALICEEIRQLYSPRARNIFSETGVPKLHSPSPAPFELMHLENCDLLHNIKTYKTNNSPLYSNVAVFKTTQRGLMESTLWM